MKSVKLISAMVVVALALAGLSMGSAADVQLLTTDQMGNFTGSLCEDCRFEGSDDDPDVNCQYCFEVGDHSSQYTLGDIGDICLDEPDLWRPCEVVEGGLTCGLDPEGEWRTYTNTTDCTGSFVSYTADYYVDTAIGRHCPW